MDLTLMSFSKIFCLIICGIAMPWQPSTAQELQLLGHLSYAPDNLAGCWHHVDSSGGEWALVGTSTGLSIVEVSEPSAPAERFKVPGIMNNWREVRTWGGFAYVGSAALQSGITIVDLRSLPDTIYWKVWKGDGDYTDLVIASHTVQAEDGYLYIFGGLGNANGAYIADLADPWNPHIVSYYDHAYVHDGFIRGDTLWTSEIFEGIFGVVDISDRSNPVLLTTQPTPSAFNHNTGLSSNGTVLFTTDERSSAPLASFDVSDLSNIRLLDTYKPSRKPTGEVHNVRVINNFLVNPSYKGQLTIVDATRPENLIETAWDSLGNSLVWDADPYLPSGIILASAKAEGLFIYKKPAYRHAAWLEGHVYDASTGFPLADAKVFVTGTYNADTSRFDGVYRTGAGEQGSYTIYAEKSGYIPATIPNFQLDTNHVATLDIYLSPLVGTGASEVNAALEAYPVPFDDYVKIDLTGMKEEVSSIRLLDAEGRVMRESNVNGAGSLVMQDLKSLPRGTYWLVAVGKNGETRVRRLSK